MSEVLSASEILKQYSSCVLCPRRCGVDRLAGQHGFCGLGSTMKIAFAGLHSGEEPPIALHGGSGTIFFSGCTLACSFCQNYQISRECAGAPVSESEFADICLKLQEKGAENINLVTGTQFIPSIVIGLREAKRRGLAIPIVWNSSSWESREGLSLLAAAVDIYLPDIKTFDKELSAKVFKAPEYPIIAQKAIRYMTRHSQTSCTDPSGQVHTGPGALERLCENPLDHPMKSGLILRHLVLPDRLFDTANIFRWYSQELKGSVILSIMSQYTPVGDRAHIPALRYLNESEYTAVSELLEQFDIDQGFFQDLLPGSDWLPDFNRLNPFSSELSKPVWHWKDGFVV